MIIPDNTFINEYLIVNNIQGAIIQFHFGPYRTELISTLSYRSALKLIRLIPYAELYKDCYVVINPEWQHEI